MDSAKYTQSGRAAPGPASSAIASMANNSHNKENSNPNRYEPVYVKKSKTLMYMSVTSKVCCNGDKSK